MPCLDGFLYHQMGTIACMNLPSQLHTLLFHPRSSHPSPGDISRSSLMLGLREFTASTPASGMSSFGLFFDWRCLTPGFSLSWLSTSVAPVQSSLVVYNSCGSVHNQQLPTVGFLSVSSTNPGTTLLPESSPYSLWSAMCFQDLAQYLGPSKNSTKPS